MRIMFVAGIVVALAGALLTFAGFDWRSSTSEPSTEVAAEAATGRERGLPVWLGGGLIVVGAALAIVALPKGRKP